MEAILSHGGLFRGRNPAKTAEKCVQKIKNKASDISCHTVPYVIQAIFREKIKKMKILLLFAIWYLRIYTKRIGLYV